MSTSQAQSVYNWIKNWYIPNIVHKSVETPETLYVMADEKYIGTQSISKDIMIKCFVTFEDIKDISKNRRQLVNRSVFSCCAFKAWPKFMDFIAMKYDFSKIGNICLFADGGSWIKSGIPELKLDHNNSVKFYLCEFHFKQAIHHITTDPNERYYLLHIFNTKPKSYFVDAVNTIINNNPKHKDTITKKLKYIINNYNNIKSMLALNIGSSMESHISHLIASFFFSRPKGFSTKRIEKYIKLNDYEIFTQDKLHNIPVLSNGLKTGTYTILNSISHDVSLIDIIENET